MNKEITPLEALEIIKNTCIWDDMPKVVLHRECDIVEKSLKALDLFIKKQPCKSLIELSKSHIEYNKSMPFIKNRLTQEEYELLKEVLL